MNELICDDSRNPQSASFYGGKGRRVEYVLVSVALIMRSFAFYFHIHIRVVDWQVIDIRYR